MQQIQGVTGSLPKTSTAWTGEQEGLKSIINSLVTAMRSDFGAAFIAAFPDPGTAKSFKQRLYERMQGFEINAIIGGYESYIDQSPAPNHPPNIPQLLELVRKFETAERIAGVRRANAEALGKSLANSTAAGITCDPASMFRDALSKADGRAPEERAQRREELWRNHQAVLNLAGDKVRKGPSCAKDCAVPGCHCPGTISASTVGGDNFYCSEHWAMVA